MLANTKSIWSIGSLSDALSVPPWTIRRTLERLIKTGLVPDRRLARHFRMVSSDDFPALVAALRELGYQVPDVAGEVVDEAGEVFDRIIQHRASTEKNGNDGGSKP
jgi:hypothetical protein